MSDEVPEQDFSHWDGTAFFEGHPRERRHVYLDKHEDGFLAYGVIDPDPQYVFLVRGHNEQELQRFLAQIGEEQARVSDGPPPIEVKVGGDKPPPVEGTPPGLQGGESQSRLLPSPAPSINPKSQKARPEVDAPSRVHLLLAHVDNPGPALPEGLPVSSVVHEPLPSSVKPKHLYDLSGDLNDLAAQRWALIAPEGPRGDRLLARVARLRAHRAEQQHLRSDQVLVFRVPPAMSAQQAEEFRCRLLRIPKEDQPRYLLVLGDADEVSFELQQHLAVDRFVGRLTFVREEEFELYADKVLRAETGASRAERARALFFTAHDGTVSIRHGHEHLISRGLRSCQQSARRGGFPASELRELDSPRGSSAARLLASVAEPTPTVLLSLSHGNGGPTSGWRSPEEQRRHQGALFLGNGQTLTVDDVSRHPFLPGGVWVYFACFSVGTPQRGMYTPWLQRLKDAGTGGQGLESVLSSRPLDGRPFVAALPQAALANPEGPLAVLGHVDLAWSYAYQEPGGYNHATRFAHLLGDMVRHRRAGVGLYSLTNAIAAIDARLALFHQGDAVALLEGCEPPREAMDRAHLWMMRHDLASYLLLGDPAVRLSLTESRR